jgi:hypothetical protein
MAITLRTQKGSELTFEELDGNFTDLNNRVTTLESGGGGGGVALTDLSVTTNSASGSGTLTYSNATGVFTYTPPDLSGAGGASYTDSDVDTHLNTGTATANQILSWDGADYAWVADTGTTEATSVEFTVHNDSGATLNKGEVVYISGLNGNTPEVSKAQANSSTTMPAFGIVKDDIANAGDGTVITFGSCPGHDVSDFGETGITFALGDTLYVSATEAGKLTNVAPAGEANLIQNIGKIERATPTTNMTIKVGGAGRTNATPNLDNGNIFIGNAQNQSSTVSFNSTVDAHLNTSTATGGQILSWDGADYAWVADQTGSGSSASNLIAWDLADTANSKVLDAGVAADSAWYYGDVVSDPANPATSVVLDISAATFTGNVMGEVHGDVKQADGLTLILDVDAGVGTAMYYGDVTGNIITESVQPASSTTLDPGTVLTVKGGSTSAVNSVGGDLILDAGSGGAQGGVVKVGTVDGTGVTIGSGTGSIEMNSVTNFNANVDFESGSTVDFTGVTVTGLSGGGGSGLQSRGTVTGTTGSLADGDEADLDITGFKSYALLTITTDRAARVRLYVSDATRLADASRAEGVDPTSDAGLIAEVITTGAETVIISPGAYGFNLESPVTTAISTRITNKSGSTSTVQVDLNILQLEA